MSGHIPVLLEEVVEALAPRDGASYIDGTFGGGGYSRALLEAAKCHVTGIDRDPDAVARGHELEKEFSGRFTMIEGVFSDMENLAGEQQDGVVLDLGVSSFQFDEGDRGFSFREDGPLDMRMSKSGMSAADFVNTADEATLADVIFRYGEERQSRRIARAIVENRPITRTAELADIVARALGPAARAMKIHPATRTFQALRIHVNDELGELERGLEAAERVLKPKGRLAVVSFHSLEDRIVKRFFAESSGKTASGSRHAPAATAIEPKFRLVEKSRIPANDETKRNPRARSARLRVGERTAA